MLIKKDQWTGKKKVTPLGWLVFFSTAIFLVAIAFYSLNFAQAQMIHKVNSQKVPTPTPSPTPASSQDWVYRLVKDPNYKWLVPPPPPEPSSPRPSSWPVYRVRDKISGREKYDVPKEVQQWIIHDLWEYLHAIVTSFPTPSDCAQEEIRRTYHTPAYAERIIADLKKKCGPDRVHCKVVEEEPWKMEGMVIAGCSPDGKSCVVVLYAGRKVFACFNDEMKEVTRVNAPPRMWVYRMVWSPERGRWLIDDVKNFDIEEEK